MSEELKNKLFDKKESGWKKINEDEKTKIAELSKNIWIF